MSKKKNLLSEASVRRFATLAALPALGSAFVKEHFGPEGDLEEGQTDEVENLEEMGMGYGAREDDEMMPEEPAGEEEPEMEEPEMEEPAEAGATPEMEEFAREVASALAKSIEAASGGAISVSVEGGDEEGEAAPEMDMEEPGMEEPAPEAPEMGEPEEEEEEALEETELSLTEEDEERIVNEVFKRIAKKILKQKLSSN